MHELGGGKICEVESLEQLDQALAVRPDIVLLDNMLLDQMNEAVRRRNAVAPGVIVTSMWERNRAIPGVIEQIEGHIALRRWGLPDDVADVVVFLASDASRYVTAQTIEVDGGMASTLDLYGGAV